MEVRNPSDLPAGVHPRVAELYQRPFFKQGTEEWLEQRYDYLTASDVGAVLGKSKFKNYDVVLAEKLRQAVHQPPTEAMKHGTKTEPEARAVYERLTGNQVIQFGLLTGSTNIGGFLAASVDGITTDGIVVEIKCPYSRKIIQGGVPVYNQDQVQAQLEVTNLDLAHYFEYDSKTGETNLVEVRRDPDWWIINKRRLWDFWADVEATKIIAPERDSIPESVSQQFLENTWLPISMKAGVAEIGDDYASQARHYMDLGDKCEVELGYLDRALSCYIDAEKIAIEHDLTDILTDSIFRRSGIYCNYLGMKWYGVPLATFGINLIMDKKEKSVQNWNSIAIAELNLGVWHANWGPVVEGKKMVTDGFAAEMNNILSVFWIGQAIGIIDRNNLEIDIQPELLDYYNKSGERIGWERCNQMFTDENFLRTTLHRGSY